jgi:hypothetical protein
MMDDFRCECCKKEVNTLYEGWFKAIRPGNWITDGTATAGLIQLRRVCQLCFYKLRDAGMAKATKLPKE